METTMSKPLYFPPLGLVFKKKRKTKTSKKVTDCVELGESVTIVFLSPGYFSHDDATAFSPDLPTGNFLPTNVIGPYVADTKTHKCTMTFVDTSGNSVVDEVTIAKKCT